MKHHGAPSKPFVDRRYAEGRSRTEGHRVVGAEVRSTRPQRRAARLVVGESVGVRAVVLWQAGCHRQRCQDKSEEQVRKLTEVRVERNPGRPAGVGVVEGTRAAVRVVHYQQAGSAR